jgi:UDP-galactopyranose mutase
MRVFPTIEGTKNILQTPWLIVGAGFTGATLAERIATQFQQQVLLVDARNHIGGNAYDYHDEHGVLIHKYGPHIFHTNSPKVRDYLSQFTSWRPYFHRVEAVVEGQQISIPYNLNSLYATFPAQHAAKLENLLLEQFGYGARVPILGLRTSTDGDLKRLADFVYDNVFKEYTRKQWELDPEELDPAVTARVPILISRDTRYFQDSFQAMPRDGYTRVFERILDNPRIRIMLNTPFESIDKEIEYKKLVYTGPIDEFFEFQFGELPYRSLDFDFQFHNQERYQSTGTVNYPNDYRFTRITEFKYLTAQKCSGTTIAVEFPSKFVREKNVRYYPIPQQVNQGLYQQYLEHAQRVSPNTIFAGRLGDYRYYNMDQAVARALKLFEDLQPA